MNEQEKQYFSELVKRRTQLSEMLLMDEAKGLLGAVMNKYSDQAHFVYELIQNADDAQATEAEFILYKDRLIFKHNGKRHFSISNPSTQEIDKKKGKLGDLNAITSYASSSKENDEKSKIGKFGLGFKSVFVYSSNPHIYDSNICFSLDSRQIVPTEVEDDFPGRNRNETVFVLPFDNPEVAFDNISAKLETLKFPTLFLNGLKWIRYEIQDGREGIYSRKPFYSKKIDETDISFYKIRNGEKENTTKIYLFSRSFDYEGKSLSYSCGFMADKYGNLIPCKYDAFCYFETFETTNLKFIIHAPFLLSDNRHNILAANRHNEALIERLASLASESLVYLRDIGIEQNKRIINDDILKVIPFRGDSEIFAPIGDRDRVSFLPFYNEIKRVMASEKILPARNKYVSSDEAFWADTEEMTRLFTDEQLSQLYGENRYFVFTSFGRNTTSHNAEDGLADYIDDITTDYIDMNEIFHFWDASFTESQPMTWLFNFYQTILDARGRTNLLSRLKNIPIFLTDNGTASAAFDSNGNEILFLPDKGTEDYATIHPKILENKYGKQLAYDGFRLRTPDLQDRIFNKILSKDELDPVNDFCIFLDYYIECQENGLPFDDLANELNDREFITSYYLADHSTSIETPANIYYPSPDLLNYFDGTTDDVYFFDLNSYSKCLSSKQALHLDSFLDALNIDRTIAVRTQTFDFSSFDKQAYKRYKWQRSTRPASWEVKWVDSITTVIPRIIDNNDFDLSVFLWNSIIHILEDNSNGCQSPSYIHSACWKRQVEDQEPQ